MKKILILALLLVPAIVSAEKPDIQAHKTKILSDLDARITILQEERTCVQSAQAQSDIMKCREITQAKHEKMKKDREAEMGQRKR